MLISFSVTNYRSIKDTATLSFLPVKAFKELPGNVFKATDKINLLRSAVIYGANASGKSNVLKALEGFVRFLLYPDSFFFEKIELYDPFLLNKETFENPSKFSIEFIDNEKVHFKYSIEFSRKEVISEELLCFPKGQKTRIYTRNINNPIEYGTIIKGEKKSVETRLSKSQLFFSKAASENIYPLQDLFLHLRSLFKSISFEVTFLSLKEVLIIKLANEDQIFLNKYTQLISALDTGIETFDFSIDHSTKFRPGIKETLGELFLKYFTLSEPISHNTNNSDINTFHNFYNEKGEVVKQISFSIENESSGTKSLFSFAYILLKSLENGNLLFIDEIEQNLHPHLVNALVGLFNNPEINTKNAQLICTTHNTNLLAEDIFRRDQIWFTEKNERGETILYSMADIEGVRNNIPYDKWYLSGRFGATPIVREPDFLYRKNAKGKK